MLHHTASAAHWLKKLQEDHRNRIRQGPFFTKVMTASSAADFQWIRQLYYLSADFTAAVALRYGGCQDGRLRDAFGEHAAEEVTHPAELAQWMREFGFLTTDEEPTSVPPTLETLAIGSYLIRIAVREPPAHQIITLNLMSEGIARDLFSSVNPKLADLGLSPKGYWAAHAKADRRHELLALDLIPPCDPETLLGKSYARVAWEVASLFGHLFDSWSGITPGPRLAAPVSAGSG